MAYATPADIVGLPGENGRFEADLVAQRAAPEGQRVNGDLLKLTIGNGDRGDFSDEEIEAADAALVRINKVLVDAESLIDGFIADRYTVPLSPVPRLVKRYACDIAIYFLWGDAAGKDSTQERDYNAALKMLGLIRDGKMSLGEQPDAEKIPDRVAPELVINNPRVFTRDTLRGL